MEPARKIMGQGQPHAAAERARQASAGGDRTDGQNRLALLVELEGALRQLPDRKAVELFAVNEFRRLIAFSQAAFVRFDNNGKARISALSGLTQVNRQAPLVHGLEKVCERLRAHAGEQPVISGPLEAFAAERGAELEEWPFAHFLWVALSDREGRVFGGILFMAPREWRQADEVIAQRLGEATAHAIMALEPPQLLQRVRFPRKYLWLALLVAVLAMFIPVPMTAIAPVEVVADDPFVVAAPMDGVVKEIVVEPNTPVKAGQLLFLYDDTKLKAEAEIAAQREAVALAKLMTTRKAAFSDPQARQRLAEAKTELQLARAEHDYARRQLERVQVRAEHGGIVIFSDKQSWIGKPVRTGEKIMEIADPKRVIFRIDLPVEDGIAIREGGRVKVFLDADPLNAIEGRVRWASFHAEEVAGGLLAYRVIAELADENAREAGRLRIGFRGSAQVFGEQVPLGFYLFRRPVAAIRQFLGL